MKKPAAALAAAVAVFAMAALSGAAFAGNNNGHGEHGQNSGSAQQSSSASSDQQAGVKPSNDTKKDQTCSTGGGQGSSATCQSDTYPGKADASKRYGNGKTAAQIANGKGAPSGTPIYGPGNSQPHKICGRDVHAYKGGDCSKQTETTAPTQQDQGSSQGKVYICHATGSATNPYVLIHVSVNAESAHMRHQGGRDIVLGASPGVCPTAHSAVVTPSAATRAAVAPAAVTPAPAAATQPAAVTPASTPPAGNSGVLGASKALTAPASKPAGVLGTLKTLGTSATTGTLPFTGLRLWIVALIALGLIGTGVATRMLARRSA